MQFFKCYQREISTFVLISLLQSFVFEIFVAYSKPISSSGYFYVPILTQDNQANIGNKQREEGNQTLNYVDLLAVDPSNVMLQYEATTSDGTSKLEKNQKQVDESTIIYAADIVYGVIGVDASIPFDNPEDNLFKVMIADQIDQQATYVLSYDLNGASSAVEVAKSINTTTSIGGYLQRKNTTWTRVEEYVSPANLRQGVNTILFTADLEVTSLYKVRNLQIEKRLENKQIDAIQVNEAVRDSLTGKVYISGIVPIQEGAELYISGQRIPIEHHTFEYVEELDKALTQPLKVEFRQENEKVIAQEISLDTAKKASYTKTLQAAFERHEFEVKKGKGSGVYEHGKVKIEVPSGSFADDFTLSIQELRPSDYAPTGMGLTNVTANQGAYRFLPDGIQFDQEVILTIPYDVATLPIGYSAKDIQVFYFDTKIKQWAQVKVIDVLEASQQVVAITNHFTDYLAGVIQEPESPDGEAFTPTTLSGIHAVNPTENVPMISVPQINDQGDAVLQFPLMLPQGRHGMTPNIAMTYNSSADEGDFGLGWSLSVPTIAVDIRWGVPLYDGIKETESYIFNGDELLLVQSNQTLYAPHKDPLTNRVTNVVFQTAQHNPNLEIKRLGSLNNYTWQVTDYITGWISEYSTYARGKWYLTKVTDPYENFMEYSYNQNASGDYQLKTITYNRHQSLETGSYGTFATFTVDIFRKNTIDSPRGPRKDVKLNNRYGVESKSIDLIDKIIIKNEPKSAHITTDKGDISLGHVENEYKFLYKAGQFSRSLLYKIVNTNLNNYTRGNQGILPPDIQEYSFDYHDDIGSGGLFESTGKTIQTYKDYVTDYDRFGVYISALGGTEGKSTNFNGGGSAGIVTPIFPNSWLPFSRAATVGGNLGGGTSNTETKVMMTDIDGDGLPDKVFKDGKKFYYRKNIGDKFSLDTYPIKNLPNLSYSKSKSSDLGFSVNVFVGNISRSNAKSASTTSTYMTDVNADGLLDVVDNERVYFGYIDPQTRTPSFSLDSSITPVIVLKEEDVAPVLNPAPQVDMTNGPMDMVMVWRAPKPGQIKVTGTIGKRYVALQNGVKFSIERLNASDLMGTASFILGPNLMLSTREDHNHTLTVEKGDLLFFRVHTNQIPVEELGVTWNPKVEYIGVNPDPVMTSSRHVSTYEEGFIVGASMEHVFKEAKKYQLEWPRFIFQDKDRITIRVSYFKKGTNTGGNIPIIGNNVVIYEKTSTINEPFDFQNFNRIIDASSVTSVPSSYHYLKIEVLSDSEINWKEVDQRFKPKLKVLGSNEPDIYLTPYYSNYSKVHTSYVPIQFTGNGPEVTITIKNNFSLPACTQETCNDRYVYLVARRANGSIIKLVSGSADNSAGYIKFRYKFDATGRIVQKQRLNAHDVYENLGDTFTMVFDNVPGDKYFFEYYTTENKIGELVDAYQAYTGTNPPPPLIKITARRATPATYMTGVDNEGRVKANVYTSEPTTTWGPMYRNWGQFAYKGADVDQPYEAIVGKNIQMFNTTENTGNVTQDLLSNPGVSLDQVEQDMDEIQRLGGNMSVYFGMLLPNKKTNRWESHEHLYVAVNGISPYLRFLTDDIPDLRPPAVPVGNYGAFGINKYGSFKNNSTSKSIGFLGLSVGEPKQRDLVNC
ncbi:SpvB/TcaC N-terminal domain-containing protein [Myroides sp. mNGS23_01]|nr:SpvB/TcaC N-terminal domain-containing protein [Myroides sp. mNGS23_01]WHT38453.1 SpvB/TcaC N-terminal domain-containing protein [Myroides sp. mNGS23_01]